MKSKILSLICAGALALSTFTGIISVSAAEYETPVTYSINFEATGDVLGEALDSEYANWDYWGNDVYKAVLTIKGPNRSVDASSGKPCFKGFTVDTINAELEYTSAKELIFVKGASSLEGGLANSNGTRLIATWSSATSPIMTDSVVATWYFVEKTNAAIDDMTITMTSNTEKNFVQIAAVYDGTGRESVADLYKYTDIACEPYPEEKDVAVTGVTLDQSAVELDLNLNGTKTATLVATVTPADATDPSVTWTSSVPGVATVDGGVVTAVATGTTVITATAGDFSATCTVTVVDTTPATSGKGEITKEQSGSENDAAVWAWETVSAAGKKLAVTVTTDGTNEGTKEFDINASVEGTTRIGIVVQYNPTTYPDFDIVKVEVK